MLNALYYVLTAGTPNFTTITVHTAHHTKTHGTLHQSIVQKLLFFYISPTKIPPLQKYKKNVSIKNACYGLQLLIQLEPRVAPESSGALITTLKTDKVSGALR